VVLALLEVERADLGVEIGLEQRRAAEPLDARLRVARQLVRLGVFALALADDPDEIVARARGDLVVAAGLGGDLGVGQRARGARVVAARVLEAAEHEQSLRLDGTKARGARGGDRGPGGGQPVGIAARLPQRARARELGAHRGYAL